MAAPCIIKAFGHRCVCHVDERARVSVEVPLIFQTIAQGGGNIQAGRQWYKAMAVNSRLHSEGPGSVAYLTQRFFPKVQAQNTNKSISLVSVFFVCCWCNASAPTLPLSQEDVQG